MTFGAGDVSEQSLPSCDIRVSMDQESACRMAAAARDGGARSETKSRIRFTTSIGRWLVGLGSMAPHEHRLTTAVSPVKPGLTQEPSLTLQYPSEVSLANMVGSGHLCTSLGPR